MALRKVRSNLDRLFDKNLTDLIRGIRNNKENEARYIAACIEEIKVELREGSTFIKANAVEKLAYLQMLGYDVSWASFNIIEVMASTKFSEKRIGYLAATQSFNDETDVLMLTTNMIRKDLQSTNLYDVGVALTGLACFTTPDLARDLVNDVVNLLSSSRPYVRKKAVLLLYKVFLKYPESLRPTFPRLKDKLEDPDPGVQSAAVNVICELARKNPKNYLSLAPVFFKLMNTSSNNWMLIKIIKLFGSLVPLESRLGKKLLEPLTNLINSTSAMSLLYECINTVIAVLISISSESPGDFTASIQLCVQKLGVLIEDSDQNLKYLGLLAMSKILQTHPKAVQAHKDIVLRCLDDKDESIRLRALDLLYGMVSKKNIMEIVKKLMEHVDAAEGSFYRDELLSRIIDICCHNNYQYITNFEWYISVLVEMTKVEGSKHGIKIAQQIQDVTVRVQSIRHFSVSQMALLVENAHLLLSGNSTQRNNLCQVLLAAAWICGEYSEHVRDIQSVLEAMLRVKMSIIPGSLLSVYVQNIAKLYAVLLLKYEKDDDWDIVESLDNLMLSKLPEFQLTDHLEAQERSCNFVEILRFIEKQHSNRIKMGEAFSVLFEGELNPVAAKAQKKVPIPEVYGKDNRDTVYGSETQSPSPKASKKIRNEEELKLNIEESKKRRQKEQESNPYYVKGDKKPMQKKVVPKGMDRSESMTTAISELQSPLEIPGVIGLDSDEGGDPKIVHQVNRDDGEMPEGAVSTDDEGDKNGIENEFKALDMNLDEPLRDDERLFAETLGENPDLKLVGKIKIAATGEETRATASIKMKNRGQDTIRRLEMSVFETENATLDTSAGITDSASIMLPFELTSGAVNEHNLHFVFKNVQTTQKIRVTLMYCLEKSEGQKAEDRLNFTLTFPAIRFLIYATIGSTSYELILADGEFAGSSSEKSDSKQNLKNVIDEITSQTNFSVVEVLEDAVSLYAHASDDSPVCVLLKKQQEGYIVNVKCQEAALANSLAQDLKEVIDQLK
ncbi:hypothetical protein FO519_005748 [Halicephalobus sp. NKZ332]|nr:hypothetical protein FO519_005748 [Halicephalobus sp. NKZ332]